MFSLAMGGAWSSDGRRTGHGLYMGFLVRYQILYIRYQNISESVSDAVCHPIHLVSDLFSDLVSDWAPGLLFNSMDLVSEVVTNAICDINNQQIT